ncbi:MAG: hypothetical protein IT306_30815 [Chloroflexi bacterium]|nr:hypothetical protein [Chloroflexota bacterium]
MSRLGMIYLGSAQQHMVLQDPVYRQHIDELVYLPELPATSLDDLDGLIVPCRVHQGRLYASAEQVRAVLDRGGTVVLFGEQPQAWLPGLQWEQRPVNFWWWREGGKSDLRAALPEHSLFEYLTLADATWHYHGVFTPPAGAERIIESEHGGTILYVDRVSTPGTLIVTSLDPMFHIGSNFMPAAARFFQKFLPWLRERMLPETSGRQPTVASGQA